MNERRIVLNTLATYGRSVVGALLGLFSARWVLETLGSSDFGLYGVVGGVVFVFSFLSPVLAISIGRFYAFFISSPEKVRQWFNTAVGVMSVLAVALVAVAYPIGVYALGHWLVVPDGRMAAAVWVLRFALLSALVSMIALPYQAMFTAKQDIVEASLFQLGQTVLTFGWVAFMKVWFSLHGAGDSDWLILYAAMLSAILVGVQVVQAIRAYLKYAECRVVWGDLRGRERVKPLLAFTGWQFLGGLAWMVRSQGLAFLVNILFGTSFNASYTISNQVSNQASSLSASLCNAVAPALTAEEGGGRRKEMLRLARRSSLLGGALVLLFAVPLILLINPILKLWLGTPPPGCAQLCVAMLVVVAVRQFASGHGMAILAHGHLGPWQICDAVAIVLSLPVAAVLWKLGYGIASIGWAYVVSEGLQSLIRVYFARSLEENDIISS